MSIIKSAFRLAAKTAGASIMAASKFGEIMTEEYTVTIDQVEAAMSYVLERTDFDGMTPFEQWAWFRSYTAIAVTLLCAVKDEDFEEAKSRVKAALIQVRSEHRILSDVEAMGNSPEFGIKDSIAYMRRMKNIGANAGLLYKEHVGEGRNWLLHQLTSGSRLAERFEDITHLQMDVMFMDVPEPQLSLTH